jgi:transcriptional regulator with XRE-family HTH domain
VPDADEIQRRFGDRLKEVRLAGGISQMELAHRSGLHPTYVSSVERGQRNVSLINIYRLAEALEIRPAGLLS